MQAPAFILSSWQRQSPDRSRNWVPAEGFRTHYCHTTKPCLVKNVLTVRIRNAMIPINYERKEQLNMLMQVFIPHNGSIAPLGSV